MSHGMDIGKYIEEAEALAYPPPQLRPRTTRITSLPMLAFAGLIDSAPISYEEAGKARDIAAHHHFQHELEHRFNDDLEAYQTYLKTFGDDRFRSTRDSVAVG